MSESISCMARRMTRATRMRPRSGRVSKTHWPDGDRAGCTGSDRNG
jgi:hypothetical protein